jgi:transcription initiation factor TFIID subunit 11
VRVRVRVRVRERDERMKQVSKDPFEAAFEEQEDSPAVAVDGQQDDVEEDYDGIEVAIPSSAAGPSTSTSTSTAPIAPVSVAKSNPKSKYDDQEEENMDVELSKLPSAADPAKMAKMQYVLLLTSFLFHLCALSLCRKKCSFYNPFSVCA